MSSDPYIQYVRTSDGVNIAYFTLGKGTAPPLVLMDAVYSHVQAEWNDPEQRQLYEAIGRVTTFVRYDHRGFGMSDRDVDRLTLEGFVLDVEAVVERALPGRRFALVAQRGVTTPIAVAYAVGHPDRLTHLVLTPPLSRMPPAFMEQMDLLLDSPAADERFVSEAVARLVQGWDDDKASRAMAARMRESTSIAGYRAFINEAKRWDVRQMLPEIRKPTLLMPYRNHPLFPESYAHEIAAVVPGARVVIIDGATSAERGVQTNDAVADFLSGGRLRMPTLAITPPPQSAFRTILFTDIVGHTEMMQRLGDARGRGVLREHERITREALSAHGGAEVKTDGDSFMATFASTSSAVECAIALQRAFAQHAGRHADGDGEPIVVRMGLNVGEPIEEDGDFFGSAVILGARIKDQAGGGEILAPEAVRHMLAGKGFVFADRGEVVLKGFAEGVRLYEVRWQEGGG